MTQEDKKLLLKDLCARLPYGLIVNINNIEPDVLKSIQYCKDEISVTITTEKYLDVDLNKASVKPYLRPMSSMTEEERNEYRNIDNRSYSCPMDYAHIPALDRIDWLNKKMFDYRGLIEKGLALEAPNGMYNIKKK